MNTIQKITLAIVGFVVVAALGVGVYWFMSTVEPVMAVGRGMSNMGSEFQERISTTPLKSIGMLVDSIEYGTTNIEVRYISEWYSWWADETYRDEVNINARIASIAESGEYDLLTSFNIEGIELEFSLLANNDRVAINIESFDNNFYGFYFDSFRADFRPLGELMGLNQSEIDEVADVIEEFHDILVNSQNQWDSWDMSEYSNVLLDFFRDAEQMSERVQIAVDGEEVRGRRIAYYVNDGDVSGLLRSWLTAFENDEFIADMFSSAQFGFDDGINYHLEAVMELTNLLQEFERNVSGEMTLAFYLGARDRLLAIRFETEVVVNGEEFLLNAVVDFGAYAKDVWSIEVTATFDNETANVYSVWEIDQIGNTHVHSFDFGIVDYYDDFAASMMVISNWHSESGRFDFSFAQTENNRQVSSGNLFGGIFRTDGETFTLIFEHEWESWGDHNELMIQISTESGANIRNVDFVNINTLDEAFIIRLEDFIWELES